MKNLLFALEAALPHWLGTPQMQWVQWVYGIWQLVRCNAFTLFLSSYLVAFWKIYSTEKKVVVVSESEDLLKMRMMPLEEMMNHQWRTLTIEKFVNDNKLCFLKYGEYYYYAHTDTLRELAECERLFGENMVFVERLLPVVMGGGVSVGRMISQREAYEKILSSKNFHFSRAPIFIGTSLSDYVDVSSKLWGVLSTIPILLQAKSYNKVSTLLSFVIILLDLNRHRLYRIYDGVFNGFAKFVKLHILKELVVLQLILSVFSSRWNIAQESMPGERVWIRPYCKLKSMEDLEINDVFKVYGEDRQNNDVDVVCVEIDIDRAISSWMQNNVIYTKATLKRTFYAMADANWQWWL